MTNKRRTKQGIFEEAINIGYLQEMYSPIFDKNFSEMTNDEIKQQLDYWVENDYELFKKFVEVKK
jgi:hypothetical protein